MPDIFSNFNENCDENLKILSIELFKAVIPSFTLSFHEFHQTKLFFSLFQSVIPLFINSLSTQITFCAAQVIIPSILTTFQEIPSIKKIFFLTSCNPFNSTVYQLLDYAICLLVKCLL